MELMASGKSPNGNYDKVLKPRNKEKVLTNIWSYAVGLGGTTNDRIAFEHPAIFPEKLAEDHILSWTNPDDLVFDPMCGSGTTGKMAFSTIGSLSVWIYHRIHSNRKRTNRITFR